MKPEASEIVSAKIPTNAGADPGFPVEEGANPSRRAPTYDFAKLSENLHKIEKILGRRGARRGIPLDPPL